MKSLCVYDLSGAMEGTVFKQSERQMWSQLLWRLKHSHNYSWTSLQITDSLCSPKCIWNLLSQLNTNYFKYSNPSRISNGNILSVSQQHPFGICNCRVTFYFKLPATHCIWLRVFFGYQLCPSMSAGRSKN